MSINEIEEDSDRLLPKGDRFHKYGVMVIKKILKNQHCILLC
ncbi:MAG: hypothetical protein ACKPFD_22225 [Dolichospermum sp.]